MTSFTGFLIVASSSWLISRIHFRIHWRRYHGDPAIQPWSQRRRAMRNRQSLLARKTYAGIHGSLRDRQKPPHDGHPSVSTFLCNARGLQNSRTTPSRMAAPTPQQGRLNRSVHGEASKRERCRHQADVHIGLKAQPSPPHRMQGSRVLRRIMYAPTAFVDAIEKIAIRQLSPALHRWVRCNIRLGPATLAVICGRFT